MLQMQTAAAAAGDSTPRSVVFLPRGLCIAYQSWGVAGSEVCRWAFSHAFDEVVHEAPAGGRCLRNVRLGRPRLVFWPSFQSLMQFQLRGVVRSLADRLRSHAGGAAMAAPPSWPPRATLILRGGGRREKTYRVLSDPETLVAAFREVGITLETIILESFAPVEQLELMARTDILLGAHGAGLAMGIYMQPGALLVALNPTELSYWETTLFHRLAMLAGLGYYEWGAHAHERARADSELGVGILATRLSVREQDADVNWCEDVRVIVAQVIMVWMREAERAHALRGR